MSGYLQDGCTQADIDRWFDGFSVAEDESEEDHLLFPGVDPIFADEDIDDEEHPVGPILGCLGCRETRRSRWGITSTYLLAELYCGECLKPLLEVWR